MAKVVDITEKLSFEENPRLVIKGKELEVNADAATVLKIMGTLSAGNTTPKQVVDMYNLIFPEETKQEIEKLKLSFKDFQSVVENAINLITGADEEEVGEDQTHTTV